MEVLLPLVVLQPGVTEAKLNSKFSDFRLAKKLEVVCNLRKVASCVYRWRVLCTEHATGNTAMKGIHTSLFIWDKSTPLGPIADISVMVPYGNSYGGFNIGRYTLVHGFCFFSLIFVGPKESTRHILCDCNAKHTHMTHSNLLYHQN